MTRRVVVATGEVLKTALNAETLQSEWGVSPESDMLYVTVRAISSRVNANYDGWPAEELEKAYKSFVGRGVYVEHNNWDPSRSRGVILGSKLHKAHLANGDKDYWIELLEEIDAKSFPKLAEAVLSGSLKSVSMGADVGYTVCSVCAHKATEPVEYCEHIAYSKGTHLVTGGQRKLVWEDCYDVGFFEISHVFDPADESADVLGKYLHTEGRVASQLIRERAESLDNYYSRLKKVASKSTKIAEEMRLPERAETLRDDSEDMEELSVAEMSDPDLTLDRETITEFKEYLDKIEEGLDESNNDKENDMADEDFDPNDMDEEMEDEEMDTEDGDMEEDDEDMEMEASRISKIRRRAGDLDVTYDNQTTMTTDGEYEGASEMAPAAETGATWVDTMAADAVEDVEALDASAVSGTPGQSEVNVASRAKKKLQSLRKRAEDILITDVENLDGNPASDTMSEAAPDMVADVTAPTTGDNQLALADRPDDIDDGTETGFSQQSPPDTAKAFEDTNNNYVYEAAKKAARRQMMSAIEVYDLKEQLGLTDRKYRVAEIAKLEDMDTKELVGYKKALLEVQSKTASNSKRVASKGSRFPEMGRSSKVSSRESDNLDDSLITL